MNVVALVSRCLEWTAIFCDLASEGKCGHHHASIKIYLQ